MGFFSFEKSVEMDRMKSLTDMQNTEKTGN